MNGSLFSARESRTILPAEWAPQSAVMLTWPHANTDWAENLAEAESVFINIARVISVYEQLIVTCCDESHKESVLKKLLNAGIPRKRLSIFIHPSNDSWARDHGPIGVLENGHLHLLNFQFNGWGGKYPAEKDNQLSCALHHQHAFGDTPFTHLPFVLEGGSIDSDGQGQLLTTRACLLSPARNPSLDKSAIEQRLSQYLGTQNILWLQHGWLRGDDTDGHIDMLARFCDPTSIAYSCCEDESDEHFAPLQAMQQELAAFRTRTGKAYKLVPLPVPQAIYNEQGQRLPASYANFLIINEAVLVPQYDDPADETARANLQTCFPDRQIVGINCLPLIQQYGSLHCLTMQLPQAIRTGNET